MSQGSVGFEMLGGLAYYTAWEYSLMECRKLIREQKWYTNPSNLFFRGVIEEDGLVGLCVSPIETSKLAWELTE